MSTMSAWAYDNDAIIITRPFAIVANWNKSVRVLGQYDNAEEALAELRKIREKTPSARLLWTNVKR